MTWRPKRAVTRNIQHGGWGGVVRASLMLFSAKPKVISAALGHSSLAFTMDVYSHIIEGMQSDAMALLDEVLPIGKNGVKNKINAKLTPTSHPEGQKEYNLASWAASSTGRAADS